MIFGLISAQNSFGVYLTVYGCNMAVWGRYGVTEGMIYWLALPIG
jgi:hypothetical protein